MAKKKARKRRPKLDATLPIFEVKIALEFMDPPIWRRVQTGDCSLDDLHEIIQTSMGWQNAHMHGFMIDGELCDNPELGGDGDYDSRQIYLRELVEERVTYFEYEYDFGDSWKHTIEIEKTLPAETNMRYPRCTGGERACPPEDCGGPYRYGDLLASHEDSDDADDDYQEFLEWAGGEFDPELFDLDDVNRELRHLRQWLGRRKGDRDLPAVFGKGDLVRVKSGTVHAEYADIPLGGWVGKIKRIAWLVPVAYKVQWTKTTLAQVHPTFFKRCRRDDEKPRRYWIDECDLEPANDEMPVAIEQPTNIITPELSLDNPEDRIRMVFGLTSDDPLPKATKAAQQRFLDYLQTHLSFPFEARRWKVSDAGTAVFKHVQVIRFARSAVRREHGIMCVMRKGEKEVAVPLLSLDLSDADSNYPHVGDYRHWMWSIQDKYYDDEESDQDAMSDEDGMPQQWELYPSELLPLGTVAYYGPDETTATKIAAAVFLQEDADPILQRWVASDVETDPKIQQEIAAFFQQYGVKHVASSEGIIGCPHEEGADFPVGGDCPFCPYWKGKQGSGAKKRRRK